MLSKSRRTQNNGSGGRRTAAPTEEGPASKYVAIFLGGVAGAGICLLFLVSSLYSELLAVGVLIGPISGGFTAGFLEGTDIRRGGLVGTASGAIASLGATAPTAVLLFIPLVWAMGHRDFTVAVGVSVLLLLAAVLIGAAIGAVLGLVGGVIGAQVSNRPVI